MKPTFAIKLGQPIFHGLVTCGKCKFDDYLILLIVCAFASK
jgi:hypothetical protein